MPSYLEAAKSDAKDAARNFLQEIAEGVADKGKASDDINNDYPNGDGYFHETFVDRAYSLTEAAEVLEELYEYEETDEALWHGLKPRDAISAQAAYTYGAAVGELWNALIKEINEDSDVADARQRVVDAQAAADEEPDDEDKAGELADAAAKALQSLQSALEDVINAF